MSASISSGKTVQVSLETWKQIEIAWDQISKFIDTNNINNNSSLKDSLTLLNNSIFKYEESSISVNNVSVNDMTNLMDQIENDVKLNNNNMKNDNDNKMVHHSLPTKLVEFIEQPVMIFLFFFFGLRSKCF